MTKCSVVRVLAALAVAGCLVGNIKAQEKEKAPQFSHKGLKASIASLSIDMTDERNLNEGEGGALNLGYGFTDRFSLWLTLLGSEHHSRLPGQSDFDFGGVEVSIQHKFETRSRWQPYGRLGAGVYGLEEKSTDVALIGAGINVGLGIDFFFSKHVGVGAEASFRKLDYFKESLGQAGDDIIRDVNPDLNGDAAAFMLTLTFQ